MKRILFLVVVFSLLTGGIAAAADTQRQREQKEADIKQLELRMREADQRMSSLGGRVSSVSAESRSELNRLLEELAKKKQLVATKMAELGSSDNAAWDRQKAQAYAALDDYNRVYDRIISLLRKS